MKIQIECKTKHTTLGIVGKSNRRTVERVKIDTLTLGNIIMVFSATFNTISVISWRLEQTDKYYIVKVDV